MLSWQKVDCPKCGQPSGEKCRTLVTGRVTDTHNSRIDLAHDLVWRRKFEAGTK